VADAFFRALARLCLLILLVSAAFPALAAVLVPPPVGPHQIALHEIDVDQGAATLIETPCGTVMIDAGGREDNGSAHLMEYLAAYFAARPELNSRLAAVFLTHTHIDHDLALMEVAQTYAIGGFVFNGHTARTLSGAAPLNAFLAHADAAAPQISVERISGGKFWDPAAKRFHKRGYTNAVIDPLNCPGTNPRIRALSGSVRTNPGWSAREFKNDNSQSLVIRIDYGAASSLFMGDREEGAQRTLIANYAGTSMLDVDVYHVSHHGSYNGTTDETMTALTPEIAVMGVGRPLPEVDWSAWAYGHPRKQAIDALEAGVTGTRPSASKPVATAIHTFSNRSIDKAIYATGWDGDVVITADDQGNYAVTTSTHP
jgi:beta-lactamase superfamily II metal-dependent hydrolase